MTHCPHHPEIELPAHLICPLCAQERRRAAYAVQKAEMTAQTAWAVHGLLRPATAPVAGQIIAPGVAIIGETLADVLNLDTWEEIKR